MIKKFKFEYGYGRHVSANSSQEVQLKKFNQLFDNKYTLKWIKFERFRKLVYDGRVKENASLIFKKGNGDNRRRITQYKKNIESRQTDACLYKFLIEISGIKANR